MADRALPSWNGGPAKTAILDFVARITMENSLDTVRSVERIAIFDGDGTLRCEQPVSNRFFFAFDGLEALAAKDPELRERRPFKAFLEQGIATVHALGKQTALEIAFFSRAGMTADEFTAIARDWRAAARHPRRLSTRPISIGSPWSTRRTRGTLRSRISAQMRRPSRSAWRQDW